MTDTPDVSSELGVTDARLGERLADERPVPPAGFRGALGRHLGSLDPGYGPRPAGLRLMAAGFITTGAGLIALGALTATGVL